MNPVLNNGVVSLNNIGRVFCDHATGIFVQSALLVGVLLVMDLLLRRRVRAVFRYWVWMLVLVKLLLPPTLSLPTGIGYWFGDRLPAASLVSERVSDATGYEPAGQPGSLGPQGPREVPQAPSVSDATETEAPVAPAALRFTSLTWQAILLLFWLAGVLAFTALLAQRVRFVKGLVARSRPAGEDLSHVLDQCRRQVGIRRQIRLSTSDTISSPAVCGLLRPCVLIPAALLESLSPEGLKAVLIHELVHIQRGDLWVTSVQTFLQVLHFHNPFVWLANAVIRRIREEAVDETVLVTLGGEAKNYSNTLIDIGEMAFWKADFGLRLVGVAESRKALQWRIKHMLTRPVPKSARIGALGTIAILVVAAVLLPMARAEKSNKEVPAAGPATPTEATEKAPPAAESDTIVDPKTGLKFTVAKKITGENDEIVQNDMLSLSPNGKFLLWYDEVIPLDGSKPFKLEALRGARGYAAWSPDGKLIAYRVESGIWLLPVSPETGQPTGPARKLADGNAQWTLYAMEWTADAQQIRLDYVDRDRIFAHPTCLSVEDGKPVPSPEHPRSGMDYTRFGLRSPDGRRVAFSRRVTQETGVWVASSAGGPPKFGAKLPTWKLHVPLWWSPDGQWLLCGPDCVFVNPTPPGFEFMRLADGFVFNFEAPESAGKNLRLSADGKRLLFYKNSREWQYFIKTAAVRGEAPVELKMSRQSSLMNNLCCPDGKRWCYLGPNNQGKYSLMVTPLAGGEPVEVKINVSLGDLFLYPCLVSPDGKRLFFLVRTGGKRGLYLCDGYVMGISWDRGETTGEPVLVCKGWGFPAPVAWSSDSTRLIIRNSADAGWKGDLWVVPADGSPPSQVTHSPDEPEGNPTFSPDGQTIAYTVDSSAESILYVMPSDGGTPRALWTQSRPTYRREYSWFPDSKEIGVLSSDAVVAVSVEDGKTRPFLKFADAGFEWVTWLEWSPDGQTLGLYGGKDDGSDDIALFHASDNKIEKLPNDPLQTGVKSWTPDSQTIGYVAAQRQKVRPAGAIYGLDVEEALQKAVAGAPPVQDKPPAAALDLNAPPLVNGEYTDHFDGPLAPHWKVVEQENQPTHVHEVQNGQFVLENGAAILGGYEWTNYVFKVRMCVKPPWSPIASLPSVVFRRNANGAYWLGASPSHSALGFGVLYGHPANERHVNAALGTTRDRAFAVDTWYTLEVEVKGTHIKASVDGQPAFEVDDATFPQGAVELRAEGARVHFDDFRVRLLP